MDEEYSTIETSSTDTEMVDVKNNEEQKEWMKRIFLNYKPDASTGEIENLWSRVSEMVGFFSEPVSTGGGSNSADTRRVVCYPDLPAAAAPPNHDIAYRAGGAVKVEDPYRTTMQPRSTTIAPIIAGAKQEPREDPYQCNVCNKTFAVPARLTRHYRTHTGERPFQCDFCDKKFGVKENLSVHRRIHTKERPYKCEVCSRAFEHSGKLHRHMRIHTGERPHACSVCNKTFIQSGQLVIHMRTHTGEKPYVCPVCDKGFTCSKQLKVHSRTHTGEKPYNCDICGKSFGYNHVLKLHQVAHYGQKVYKCTICQDTFTSKKTMEAHIKTHSENSPQSPTEHSLSSSSSSSLSPLSPTMGTPTSVLQHNTNTSNNNNNPEQLIINNSDSSCTSDKENKDLLTISVTPSPMEQDSPVYYQQRQSCSQTVPSQQQSESQGYPANIYSPRNTDYVYINSALLAAAAAAREERTHSPPQAQTPYDGYPTMATDMRNFVTVYVPSQKVSDVTPPRLDNGNGIRKCIEAVLATAAISSDEDPLLITPPNSHSTSPSPSVSPEPVDYNNTRQTLILPPRKRTKAILKSMQQDNKSFVTASGGPVRYCSVIQFGGSSV